MIAIVMVNWAVLAHVLGGALIQTAPVDPVWAFLGWILSDVIGEGLKLVPEMAYATPVIILLISLGKKYGVVKDGSAGLWQAGANGIVYLGFLIAHHYSQDSGYVAFFGQAASMLPIVIGLLTWIFGSAGLYKGLKAIGIAYSFPAKPKKPGDPG